MRKIEMTKEQKSPTEIAKEIVDKGMILSPSHGFNSMRERMEAFIAATIKNERAKVERFQKFVDSYAWDGNYCQCECCETLKGLYD
jgi:hypothetical protein